MPTPDPAADNGTQEIAAAPAAGIGLARGHTVLASLRTPGECEFPRILHSSLRAVGFILRRLATPTAGAAHETSAGSAAGDGRV